MSPDEQAEEVPSTPGTQDGEQPSASADAGSEAAASGEPEAAPRRQRATSGRATRSRRGAASGGSDADANAPVEGDENVPQPRLREMYRTEIIPSMMREFGYSNPMQVPRVNKIVLNIGLGEALTNGRAMENATRDLATITGQKPVITRARKSIAGFKIREGNPIGTSVTLRGARMHHFLDRFINTALPRIRDFRGLPRRGFDGRGNFSLGISEQIIFPEIDYNQIDRLRGLQVTIATSARNDSEATRLLELFGMPFIRQT
jgi:large subunit ribosomal protein L5